VKSQGSVLPPILSRKAPLEKAMKKFIVAGFVAGFVVALLHHGHDGSSFLTK